MNTDNLPGEDLHAYLKREKSAKKVVILYTNHRGETAERTITPGQIRFAESQWHAGRQWLLDAWDEEKHVERSFALKDIKEWKVIQ